MLSLLSRILAPEKSAAKSAAADTAAFDADIAAFANQPYEIIHAPREIERLLQRMMSNGAPLMLNVPSQPPRKTSLKAVDTARGQILVKQLWDEAEHAALLADGRLNISAEHEGSTLLFTLDLLGDSHAGGCPCYRLPFPAWILSVQMRECLRIRLPKHLQATLRCTLPGQERSVEAHIYDISEGGVGLLLPAALTAALAVGEKIKSADLLTTGDSLHALRLYIRHISPRADKQSLIGAAFNTLSIEEQRFLRRLILLHQHTSQPLV